MSMQATTTRSRRRELLASAPVQERLVLAAGVETAVLEGGQGQTLILLHGPGESSAVWLPVLGTLTRTHRVVAVDLPGHGASGDGPSPLAREWFDTWLGELISATCATPPVLVGRVVGGAVAAHFAASRPSSVAHLVLVDTLGLEPFAPDPRFGLALHRFLADPSIPTYERFMEFCSFDLDSVRRQLGPRWMPYAEYAVELVGEQRMQVAMGGLIGLYGATPIPAETWARIEVPTSLIWGRHDAATPIAVAERAAVDHGWSLQVIEDAGDDPALDRPADFVAALHEAVSQWSENIHRSHTGEAQMSTVDTHEPFAPREAWDAIAAGYDEFVAPGEDALATEILRMVGLRADHRLLDVAAGTGGLSLPAARLGATVLATDWSPAMIARFDARVDAEKLPRAEGRVMDAHSLDLGADEFDVTASQFGVMLVPDQARALREMVRVTRPGGRVMLVAYGPAAEFEALQVFLAAVQTVVPDFEGLPTDPPPLEFQVADPRTMRERLATAGLRGIAVDTLHEETVSFATGQQFWDWMWHGNPVVGMVVGELSDPQRTGVREVVDALVRERAGAAERAEFTARLTIGMGWK